MDFSISIFPSATSWLMSAVLRFAAALGIADEDKSLRNTFTQVVTQYDAMIKRVCFGYSKTAEDLEDLYQDVLVNLWGSLPRFRGEASMKTWIYRIALNTCVSNLRSDSKRPKGTSVYEYVDVADDYQQLHAEIKELHECIATLNSLDKAIMMLWLDEYSYDEIAAMVGITRGNVAQRLHRAKEKLKKIYSYGK